MIPKSEWKWYGYAGHLCISKRCTYHLSTRIGGYLVSTVGHYLYRDKMETIGAGKHDFFETAIFYCDGETPEGDPNVTDWTELYCRRYEKSTDAERGHYEICEKWADLE